MQFHPCFISGALLAFLAALTGATPAPATAQTLAGDNSGNTNNLLQSRPCLGPGCPLPLGLTTAAKFSQELRPEIIGIGHCKGAGCPETLAEVRQPRALSRPYSAAAALPSLADAPYLGKDFREIDTGLDDCSIPFDELVTRSPDCKDQKPEPGERCESYAANQFPEVVALYFGAHHSYRCSGTLIAPDLLLTAAHCFIGQQATQKITTPGTDLVLKGHDLGLVSVNADNAITLSLDDRVRLANQATVYARYSGRDATSPFAHDLALLKLDSPFPAHAVEPASLATAPISDRGIALAGYGNSDAHGGSLGQFGMTWVKLSAENGRLAFSPYRNPNGTKSAFCQGDSGGPGFAGRPRGCTTASGEKRPHSIRGVISFNFNGISSTGDPNARAASAECAEDSEMDLTDVTTAEDRAWICKTAGRPVTGCP